MKPYALCCGVLLLATVSVRAGEKLNIRVSPSMGYHPATVVVHVYATRNAENRGMEVIADSANFYRSSAVQLEGEAAPFATDFTFRDVPEGEYAVIARLIGRDGKPRASVTRYVNIY